MSHPAFVEALLQADAYPHECQKIELVETHISWVFLTGQFAYKLKKPVALNFVDFSTLERRAHFCHEELRCNSAFAPELYDAVVPVNFDGHRYRLGGAGQTVEWAVRMVQFPSENQLDRLLESGSLELTVLRTFGLQLAAQHEQLPVFQGANDATQRVLKPALDNFRTLESLPKMQRHRHWLATLQAASVERFEAMRERFEGRVLGGFVRECHGDLHLSNLVLTDLGVRAFDCLEFNADLRWIDVASDVAFLLMDCCVRGRDDLAYGFLDGYLTHAGDYDGVALLPFYQAYRSMVRAKVAALRAEQNGGNEPEALRRLDTYLQWTDARLQQPPGGWILMCGVSGSGKSYLAERLAPRIPAIRLRSDVARKRLAGLRSRDASASPIDGGLYTPANSQTVYAELLRWTDEIAIGGEHVIVDATFLQRAQRREFVHMAKRRGVPCVIAHCHARQSTLEQRLRQRERQGSDVSEAGVAVLHRQLQRFENFADEPVLSIDTGEEFDEVALAQTLRQKLRG